MRKISLTLLVGGLLAASALVAIPAMAGPNEGEATQDWSEPRTYNSGYSYTYTTTGYPTTYYTTPYYTAPAPVVTTAPVIAAAPVVTPAPGTTVTTYNNGVASYTTTYGAAVTSPSVSYVAPAPSTAVTTYAAPPSIAYVAPAPAPVTTTTTVVVPPACNPYDVNRPGVMTGCD